LAFLLKLHLHIVRKIGNIVQEGNVWLNGGLFMEKGNQVKLTSAEVQALWTSYINDSAIACQFKYFLTIVEDEEIKPLVKQALDIAQGNLKTLTEIFNKEKYPIPYGFKLNEDVDVNAPRLYSDTYFLNYLHQASQLFKDTVSICQYQLGQMFTVILVSVFHN
jgi:hypothetical protein